MEIFQCGPQGGMRKSNRKKSLVIVSHHIKSIYDDRWIEGVLYYTGMGQTGNQKLKGNQNATLYNSRTNGIQVFLFEVFNDKEYTYQGEVILAAEPFEEQQPDVKGNKREVWIFPVRLTHGVRFTLEKEEEDKVFLKKIQKHFNYISDSKLKKIVEEKESSSQMPALKTTTSSVFARDPNIVMYALKRANGNCQLCENGAPFLTKKKVPFLEVHHIVYLSKGGPDAYHNVVGLCPNCHRKMHMLEIEKDVDLLLQKASFRLKLKGASDVV